MSGIVGGINLRSSGLINIGSASDGQVFTGTGAGLPVGFEAAAGGGFYESMAIIADEVAYNANAQGLTAGAWRTRNLNTEVYDPDGIVSIGSNQFTLQAGTYTLEWEVVGYLIGTHLTKIYNITDSADITNCWGLQQTNYGSTSSSSSGMHVLTIDAEKILELQHRCDTTNASHGGGTTQAADSNAKGRYATIKIYKHA